MRVTIYNPRPKSAEIKETDLRRFSLSDDISGTLGSPYVVGLQNSKLPTTSFDQFIKRNALDRGWEGVTYGARNNTVGEGIHVKEAMYTGPKDLLIYYGYLNSFNSGVNGWDNELVAQDMAKYKLIFIGDGVQDPGHADYANTQIIIARIKVINPSILLFGYVATTDVIGTFQTKVAQWNTLQVHGVMMDMAGYDYGINRVDFNTRVDYIHSRAYSKICFVNAWNPDHVLGTVNDVSYPNSTYNSGLVASQLNSTDWLLLESFAVNTTSYSGAGGYEAKGDWLIRGAKAVSLRATYGLSLAGSCMINNDNAGGADLFKFAYISSLMWSLDGFGSSDTLYGASSAAVKWWTKPDRSNIGVIWSENPVVKVHTGDSDVYFRFVEFAKFLVDFSTGAQLSSITVY